MAISAKLQKTASSYLQGRSVSGQSARSTQSSPVASPTVEKADFLPTSNPQAEYRRPLSPNPRSRPSSQLRDASLPPTPAVQVHNTPTSITLDPSSAERDEKKSRRKSWFGRSKSSEREERGPSAWVVGHPEKRPYDLTVLTCAKHVPELWDDSADCVVYLFPRTSGRGPSFRIASSLLASSKLLSEMVISLDSEMAKVSLNK